MLSIAQIEALLICHEGFHLFLPFSLNTITTTCYTQEAMYFTIIKNREDFWRTISWWNWMFLEFMFFIFYSTVCMGRHGNMSYGVFYLFLAKNKQYTATIFDIHMMSFIFLSATDSPEFVRMCFFFFFPLWKHMYKHICGR